HVMVSILEKEPLPLAHFLLGAPAELQRIVSKALRKDKEAPYQTVKDLQTDLTTLRQELELECKIKTVKYTDSVGESTHDSTSSAGYVSRLRTNSLIWRAAAVALVIGGVASSLLFRPTSHPNSTTSVGAERSLSYSLLVQKYRN